ncbi:YicC/YloC family endoribonuclease [Candidatus Nitrosacidococcus sp. I8]|uniref:YicC/YloC family endoribonuclease n=1 Tax=Candidatus Nitrosacidococcus sp. I8 TaxID=2942908 RepID=UPI0022280A44|nr:YicC/YloC family endoribonuclease [Candidatus Nitrosacidococcus sp. I8]CAH9019387.1 hypothetical protein NURINAE_01517 [Candidatus Nitrosacidococcus sp. I8]
MYSMTAFARQETQGTLGTFVWEMRSVNHRYLEVSLRLPEELRGIEAQIRAQISQVLNRGKIDCAFRYTLFNTEQSQFSLDKPLAKTLVELSAQVNTLLYNSAPINSLEVLRWPGVLKSPTIDTEALKSESLAGLEKVLDEILVARASEGKRLQVFILQRCEEIETIIGQIYARLPEVVRLFKERLQNKLESILTSLEQGRLEQEIVLFAQKSDITEELDRLKSHLVEIKQTLGQKKPVGRRLDFLMQELNREANTLAAKAADTETSQHAVDLKVLIEQMREQIQNIE